MMSVRSGASAYECHTETVTWFEASEQHVQRGRSTTNAARLVFRRPKTSAGASMVLHIVSSFVGLITAQLHTKTDGAVFRLHYRWTTSFCFLSCALVSATEYIGSAIQCLGTGNDAAPKAVNTYCWITSTYTLNTATINGSYYLSRGSKFSGIGTPGQDNTVYHNYYQWVPFFLFFQGCLFYLPHLIWKTMEGKTADKLLQGLQFNAMDEEGEQKKANIVKYLRDSRGHNMVYAFTYLACEALNWLNVIVQMLLLDVFLGGVFLEYGLKVMSPEIRSSALHSTFPRMTKCDFNYYGTGGEITKTDYLCVLPQNILNEKIFIALWFWLTILATITAVEVIWRVAVAASPVVRVQMMERRGKLVADPKLETVLRCLPLGDYCLLEVLGTNLDATNFKDILLTYSNCNDNSVLPNGDKTYRPYSHLDEVDSEAVMEARV
ncbi:innexin inx2-like isoform X2 [Scylla paramamosain]